MRRYSPIIAITLFALLSSIPLITNQTTCSDDGFFHIAKAVTLEQMIRDGQPFGRWSPEMAHGFGYPYFNYYAPLPSYALITIHSLGFIYPVALHIFFALCIWSAGLATYFFVREWLGDAAGVTASVIYMTAPYFAFDILFRSALAESFALIFPPIILFFVHRSLKTNSLFNFDSLFASFLLAALLYTHNITSLITLPLIIGYIALHTTIPSENFAPSTFPLRSLRLNLSKLFNGFIIIILGLTLSARFWLPAIFERGLVQSDKLLVPPIFTYYTNYISFNELFALPSFIDPLIINPSPTKALGLITTLIAIVGFLAIMINPTSSFKIRHSAFGIFFFLALTAYAALTISISQPLWDQIPLMPFIQFPWRLLGIASLCAAILAGASVRWLPKHEWFLSGVVITVTVLGNLSWWYPRYCSPFKETTLADTIQYEFDTFTIGTSAKGEFLPNTVKSFPEDDSFGRAIIRGERKQPLTGMPPTTPLTITNPYPTNYLATISLTEPTQLTYNQFFFPGWSAKLDNQTLNIKPEPNTGLITLNIPAGTHTIHIEFGDTPIRTTGNIITAITLFIILMYCIFRIATFQRSTPEIQSATFNSQFPISFLLIPIALISMRIFNPFTTSPFNGETISNGKQINSKLASGLNVLTVEFPPSVESGSEFDVILYLAPQEYSQIEFRPRFDLITPDGFFALNGDEATVPRWHREPPGTQYWNVGQYAQWARKLTIPKNTPPGSYPLQVNIFNRGTLEINSVVNNDGNLVSPYVSLGTIQVTRPTTPSANIKTQFSANQKFGALTLLGYNIDRDAARQGDDVYFTFFFRADQTPTTDYKFNLLDPYYPTSQWKQGDVWRFQTKARVPADADSSTYRFILKSPDASYELAPIKVIPIQRSFTVPAIKNPTSIQFKNVIELVGYNIKDNQIELIWKALGTPDQDLIAFIHVEDSSGKIIAQSDSVPANWSRPTTGWVKGEYVVDARTLPSLPNGGITVFVGLADRSSGEQFGDRLIIYKVP